MDPTVLGQAEHRLWVTQGFCVPKLILALVATHLPAR